MPTSTPVNTKLFADIDVHIGTRLRARRELMRISMPTLAKLVGISRAELEAVEAGRIEARPRTLLAASDVLNVHARYFFLEFDGQRASA